MMFAMLKSIDGLKVSAEICVKSTILLSLSVRKRFSWAAVLQISPIKLIVLASCVLILCFGFGWLLGQGSMLASVERAYIALFESMTRDNSQTGEYYVLFKDFDALQEEIKVTLGEAKAELQRTDVPNTAKIVFSTPSAGNFDLVAKLNSVRLVLGSVLPFMCH